MNSDTKASKETAIHSIYQSAEPTKESSDPVNAVPPKASGSMDRNRRSELQQEGDPFFPSIHWLNGDEDEGDVPTIAHELELEDAVEVLIPPGLLPAIEQDESLDGTAHDHRSLAATQIDPLPVTSDVPSVRSYPLRSHDLPGCDVHGENDDSFEEVAEADESPSRRSNQFASLPSAAATNSEQMKEVLSMFPSESEMIDPLSFASIVPSVRNYSLRSHSLPGREVHEGSENCEENDDSSGEEVTEADQSPNQRSNRFASLPSAFATNSEQTNEALSMFPSESELHELPTSRAVKARKRWYQKLREFVVFKKEHGHNSVPQAYAPNQSLGSWVNKQRRSRVALQRKQVLLLESVGFDWGKKKGQSFWVMKFNELKAYKAENGDCLVPTKYQSNASLGRWVSTQRSEFKKMRSGTRTALTHDNIRKLDAIGFAWSVPLPSSKR